ncbi:MAG: hypothetical protein PHR96_00605 [Clostridia bacterium]|nr:hypothetical protein [Clostridia bacterium]
MKKIYVEIIASFNKNGEIRPLKLIWEDGISYEIQKIIDIRPAASLKAGGCGIRYTCKINGQERYLFLEETKWFVEAN